MEITPRNIESVLADILRKQLKRIETNYNGAIKGSDPAYLHDLRVAIRRARFALKLFAPFVDEAKCVNIRQALGALNSKSGEVRDLDISITRLKKIFKRKKLNNVISKKLLSELFSLHEQARISMLKALTSSSYRDTINSIHDLIIELKDAGSEKRKDAAINRIFEKLLGKYMDRLSKWGDWSVKRLSSSDLHKMRIDFKRARYLMEFFLMCDVANSNLKKGISIFSSFQDVLGKHQDALTAVKIFKEASETIGLDKADTRNIITSEKKRANKSRDKLESRWRRLGFYLKGMEG